MNRPPADPALTNRPRLGDVVVERLDALATETDEPGKLTRLYLGPAHRRAADRVASWMRDAGMTTRIDALGNVVGHYAGATGGLPTLLLGSHIDTVPDGGRFDGALGVVAAIAVVERLHAGGRRLPFAVDVVAFGDEEGVRFPGTLTGSRAIAGRFDARTLDETDRQGISRRTALATFGCDVAAISAIARDPAGVLGYIEVHIEQGPVLEAEALSVGVVTAINGTSRGRVVVTGDAGHAGTVPMTMRRDALATAAEMIVAVERRAHTTPDLVATVGVLDVPNAAVNAVPGSVQFTLDVRSPRDADRHAACRDLERIVGDIARVRNVTATVAWTYDAPAARADDRLVSVLADAVAATGTPVFRLASGAGHDAMSFKDVMPFAMLFVRCRGGISHNPAEHATADDIDVATRVLGDAVERLAAQAV